MSFVKILFVTFFSVSVWAVEDRIATAPVTSIDYLPGSEQIVTTVRYPNGCYSPWAEVKGVEGDSLVIAHLAEVTGQVCTKNIIYKRIHFDMSNIPEGVYTVKDGHDGDILGFLKLPEEE